jgi:peptidyl-prolyl cis-trans isomerase B (cyclophilin B)
VTSLRRAALLLLLPLLATSLVACGSGGSSTPRTQKTQCTYTQTDQPAAKKVSLPPGDPAKDEPTQLTIATDRGDIRVSLDADKAPCTVNSFVSLAKQGYFDGTRCHRLTTQGLYVLQCGDPSATGTGGPGYSFSDELVTDDPRLQPCTGQTDPSSGKQVCTYTTGTLAMANSGPDTNGSQFFLVYRDSPLGAAYTPFGTMSAAGVKVVQAIAQQGLAADGTAPRQPVTIESVK